MKLFIGILGLAILFVTLLDAFETIILPRRVTRPFRLVRLYYRFAWTAWRGAARLIRPKKMREAHLSYFGPLSLLMLFATWAGLLLLTFAMLHWAAGSALNISGGHPNFRTDLYMSGTTFFTLGLGDATPSSTLARVITVAEAGMGFGFLAIVISYLPTLYGSFSQRELNISLLDARAGSPPTAAELLRRHAQFADSDVLTQYLRDWEIWSAQLMESHLSYPVLCYFRSQHDNQSWLAAFTAVLDVSALIIAYGEDAAKWQAQLTFAISRHAVVDLAEILRVRPAHPQVDRLPPEEFPKVRALLIECGASQKCADAGDLKLKELREMYEPYLNGMSLRLLMPLPSWGVGSQFVENWKRSAWGRISSAPKSADPTGDGSDHF
ncbi:MAG TPA: potassium channel family protein [Candidatus Dormibacteraeota bacterium]|nr:potassium channel family protein [Candidatus Dormibacteraeota bacterium]